MASIRKRTLPSGKAAWVVDYADASGKRRNKNFSTRNPPKRWFEIRIAVEPVEDRDQALDFGSNTPTDDSSQAATCPCGMRGFVFEKWRNVRQGNNVRLLAIIAAAIGLAGCTTAQTTATATAPATAVAATTTTSAYAGTWNGAFQDGTPVRLIMPDNVEAGGTVTYFYDGKREPPQTPRMEGDKIRLTNPRRYHMIVGPPSGNSMPYYWTDGTHEARTTLTRA